MTSEEHLFLALFSFYLSGVIYLLFSHSKLQPFLLLISTIILPFSVYFFLDPISYFLNPIKA